MANYYRKDDKYIQAIKLQGLTQEERTEEPVLKNRWDCQNYIFLQKEEDGAVVHYHTCSVKRSQLYVSKGWKIAKELNKEPLEEHLIEDISELF